MHFTITRNTRLSSTVGTFGALRFDEGEVDLCLTVEQPWNDNIPDKSCIPEGDYQLLPFESPLHGSTVVFHNPELGIYGWPELVPKDASFARSLCEIHSANWPFQLKGCVALGDGITILRPYGRGVTNSVITVKKLFGMLGDRQGLTCSIISA